jgi:hypothetical protein
LIDLNIDFFRLWEHRNRDGGGVDAALSFRLRHSLDAVDARFVAEFRVNGVALDHRDRFLDAADTGVGDLHDLHLPAQSFGVAGVHPQHFCCEKRRFVAASSRTDLEDNVLLVVRVLRQQEHFQGLFGLGEVGLYLVDLSLRHLAHLRIIAGCVQELPSSGKPFLQFLDVAVLLYDLPQRTMLFHRLRVGLHIGHYLRRRDLRGEVFV